LIVFVYANKDVDNNIEDALDAIFAYVDEDIEEIKDVFDIELEGNVEDCFERIVLTNNIEGVKDACEIAFNNKVNFVKDVPMHAIANTNILQANKEDEAIEDVSMLIIANKNYLELDVFFLM